MRNCDHYETLVSTWLDGQLENPAQIECCDHMVRCESCRSFYVEARALDGLLAVVRTPAGLEAPSPDSWKRIERMARKNLGRRPSRRVPAWALTAAATLVVGIGLTLALWSGRVVRASESADVVLGQSSEMTEQHFVELTKEVLRSDRRFHSAMYEIMDQVVRDTMPAGERSSEGLIEHSDEGGDGESTELTTRIPA
jgi:anti-sigma factor RsiW